MVLRFLILLSGALILVLAVRHMTTSQHLKNLFVSKKSIQRPAHRQKMEWKKRGLVLVKRSEFPALKEHLSHGDVFVLVQKVAPQHECVFGLYRLESTRPDTAMLRSIHNEPKSRLRFWAEAQKKEIQWSWHVPGWQVQHSKEIQHCSEWIHKSAKHQSKHIRVDARRLFISGSQFSEVVVTNDAVRVEDNHHRKGWWISPKNSKLKVEFQLRSAKSGLLEPWLVEFSNRHQKSRTSSPKSWKHLKTNKAFALPGWD